MAEEVMVVEEAIEDFDSWNFTNGAKYATLVGVSAIGGALIHHYLVKPLVRKISLKIEKKKLEAETPEEIVDM